MKTRVHLGFSGYIWLDTKIVFKNKKIKNEMNGSRVKGYEMNNEWYTEQAGSKFQRVNPVELFSKHN